MPERVKLARELHAEGLSYRRHVTGSGKPHAAVQKMLGR
jgi:hypothetical protein